MEILNNQYLKWWAIVPGWFLGDFIGAAAAFFLVQELTNGKGNSTNGKRNNLDFEISLLRICTMIIKADGVIDEVETRTTKDYFIKSFGDKKATRIFKEAKVSRLKNYSLRELSIVISNQNSKTTYYSIFMFLYKLAASDGEIHSSEDGIIRNLATELGFNQSTLKIIRAQFIKSNTRSKIFDHITIGHLSTLGLDDKATVADVKSAYRKLSKEFHPDMIIDMSDVFKDLAKEKYLDIQNSYNYLMKYL